MSNSECALEVSVEVVYRDLIAQQAAVDQIWLVQITREMSRKKEMK